MPKPAATPSPSKFAHYRDRKRASGLKLLRMWVPDPHTPEFQEQVKREAALLRRAREEEEVMRWIEAVTDDDEPPYDWGPEGPPAWPEGLK